ncbi:MAG: hypothetical protein ACQESG_07635 [Nanobdellota archaeon]
MESPKVLVGCVTDSSYRYVIDDYIAAIKNLDYPNGGLVMVDTSRDDSLYAYLRETGVPVIRGTYASDLRKRLVDGRNMLRSYALSKGFDYLLSLEQDFIIGTDGLKRLVGHGKPVVSAFYKKQVPVVLENENGLKRARVALPLFRFAAGEKQRQAKSEEIQGKGLMEVAAAGLGCLLIHADVLGQVPFRYEEESQAFDDIHFCTDVRQKGYSIFVDGDVEVSHRVK